MTMKKLITIAALLASTVTFGQAVQIETLPQGSGTPGMNGYDRALPVDNDYLHVPQYMPAFPTAATIWPRVVEVTCIKGEGLKCQGYAWTPKMGRGEYLFIKTIIVEPQTPVVVKEVVTVTVEKPYPVYVEIKKKKE